MGSVEASVASFVPSAELLLQDLNSRNPHGPRHGGRSPGSLPTVVSTTRVIWTMALALFAAQHTRDHFVETGVYNGGKAIAMMSVLDKLRSHARIYACDSFMGLPAPTAGDKKCDRTQKKEKAEGLKVVGCSGGRVGSYAGTKRHFLANVRKYRVRRRRLHVVKGWFNETLPPKGLGSISFLRLDGDLYASTMDALVALYPLVPSGGLVYVDDYGTFGGCRAAVDEYRSKHAISERMHRIREDPMLNERLFGFNQTDQRTDVFEAVWWQKEARQSLST